MNPERSLQELELRALIRKHGLESVEEHIVDNANAIVLDLFPLPAAGEKAAPPEGITSHLGGLPDVPEGWSWPDDLTFLGQINLEEMAPHDLNQQLPPRGLLLFFNNMYGSDEGSRSGIAGRVEFIENEPDGSRSLRRATAPPGYLPYSLSSGDGREVYREVRVTPRSVISLPSLYTRGWQKICLSQGEEKDLTDAYLELLREFRAGGRPHQLLGQHAFMDGDADEEAWSADHGVSARLIGQPVSDEEREKTLQALETNIRCHRESTDVKHSESNQRMMAYYERKRDDYLRYLEHKDEADAELSEWVLLFQMDSDDWVGTQFNDAGFAYFMIRRGDLAQARFDRVYSSLWSS